MHKRKQLSADQALALGGSSLADAAAAAHRNGRSGQRRHHAAAAAAPVAALAMQNGGGGGAGVSTSNQPAAVGSGFLARTAARLAGAVMASVQAPRWWGGDAPATSDAGGHRFSHRAEMSCRPVVHAFSRRTVLSLRCKASHVPDAAWPHAHASQTWIRPVG